MPSPVTYWWPAILRAHEREVCGDDVCAWCGAERHERCGQRDDYYLPRCVIEGERELEDEE